jgi:hypothetical protein
MSYLDILRTWWLELEYLLKDCFLTTSERINFDEYNDEWRIIGRSKKSKLNIELEGDFIRVEGSELCCSIAYPLFAMSQRVLSMKAGSGIVRLLDEKGFMFPEGTLILDRALQACFGLTITLLEALASETAISKTELVLLRNRLNAYGSYKPDQVAAIENLSKRLRLERTKENDREKIIGACSTNAKAIKNALEFLGRRGCSVPEAVASLRMIRGALGDLDRRKIVNLATSLDALTSFTNHSHPMVRDLSLVCLHKAATLLFENGLRERSAICLRWYQQLANKKINLDITLARKSVLEEILGLTQEAKDTWKQLLTLRHTYKNLVLPITGSWYDELEPTRWRKHTIAYLKKLD